MTRLDSSPDIEKTRQGPRAGHPRGAGARDYVDRDRRSDHQAAARDLVQALLPDTGKAVRVGSPARRG